jgi:hypothetical protein
VSDPPTRADIERELADAAVAPDPEMPPNLTEEEELRWLSELITAKRKQQAAMFATGKYPVT